MRPFIYTARPRLLRKALISFSREHKNSKKSTFLYLHVSETLRRIRYFLNSRGRRRPFNNVPKRSKCLHRVFGVIVVPWYSVITEKSKELLAVFRETLSYTSSQCLFATVVPGATCKTASLSAR